MINLIVRTASPRYGRGSRLTPSSFSFSPFLTFLLLVVFVVTLGLIPIANVAAWSEFEREFKSFASPSCDVKTFVTPLAIQESVPDVLPNTTACVPHDAERVRQIWERQRDLVYMHSGLRNITSQKRLDTSQFNNSGVSSIDELLERATNLSSSFRAFQDSVVEAVNAERPECEAFFSAGPDDKFLVKGRDSTERKVRDRMTRRNQSKEDALALLGDALRGSIIVRRIPCLGLVVNKTLELRPSRSPVAVDEKLSEENAVSSGYPGVHIDSLFYNDDFEILTETQVHLFYVNDGTLHNPTQASHSLYRVIRVLTPPDEFRAEIDDANAASMLLYTFGLERSINTSELELPTLIYEAAAPQDG